MTPEQAEKSVTPIPPGGTRHLIVSCHADDEIELERVITGMAVHSDFTVFDMNMVFKDAGWKYPAPEIEAYHGYAPPGFAHETLAGLLSSIPWKHPKCVQVIVTFYDDDADIVWGMLSISQYLFWAQKERKKLDGKMEA